MPSQFERHEGFVEIATWINNNLDHADARFTNGVPLLRSSMVRQNWPLYHIHTDDGRGCHGLAATMSATSTEIR